MCPIILLDLIQDLSSLARKLLARLENFLQDSIYWDIRDGGRG